MIIDNSVIKAIGDGLSRAIGVFASGKPANIKSVSAVGKGALVIYSLSGHDRAAFFTYKAGALLPEWDMMC